MSDNKLTKKLQGHRAVITGASSGLGEQYARQLAALGCDLVVAARRDDRLGKLATELETAHGVKVEVIRSDLAKPGAAFELHAAAVADERPVTILVNNAGIGPYSKFIGEARERLLDTIQLNTLALTELCHLFATHMVEHGQQSYIANVGSVASFQGVPNFAVYSGTKAYVRVFSEILAHELKESNISVTCICPGGTVTEFMETNGQALKESAHSFMMTADDVVRQAIIAMLAGQTVLVPGLFNKVTCFLPRLMPSKLAIKLAGMAMDRNVEVSSRPALPGDSK